MASKGGSMSAVTKPKFELGQLLTTPGALQALSRNGADGSVYADRHRKGDWGNVSDHSVHENERALIQHDPIMSAYTLEDGTRIWIVTEADRGTTTILLPEEY